MEQKKVSTAGSSPKKSRSLREMIDVTRDYVRIAKIVSKMSEEERCDFFDWWQYARHEERGTASTATRKFRDIARGVGLIK